MSLVEQIRSLHSDLERHILRISDELQHKAPTKKQSIHQDHRINHNLAQIQTNAHNLLTLHQDPHHALKSEINALASKYDLNDTIHLFEKEIRNVQMRLSTNSETQGSAGGGTLHERTEQRRFDLPFYERIQLEQQILERRQLMPSFTSEERYGKYVDLNENYMEYLQLRKIHHQQKTNHQEAAKDTSPSPSVKQEPQEEHDTHPGNAPTSNDTTTTTTPSITQITDYTSYLKYFNRFHEIDVHNKDNDYLQYLKGLHNYFIDFFKRTQPLSDIQDIMQKTEKKFEHDWKENLVIGWEKFLEEQHKQQGNAHNQPNAQKKKKARRGRKRKRPSVDTYHEIALLEVKINRMVEMIAEEIEATQNYLQKKQTLTWEELQAEVQRDEELEDAIPQEEKERQQREKADESSKSSHSFGSDRSMPVWLYKRRGLNIEYVCEICGNYSYWGPVSFRRHFQEWRHQHGMKCLRVPNTKHFDGITSIKEALELWDQMQNLKQDQEFNAAEEMEMEDDQGNVYDRKTYEDLKKQGLL